MADQDYEHLLWRISPTKKFAREIAFLYRINKLGGQGDLAELLKTASGSLSYAF